MSNDISCVNHDRRKSKGFYDPFIDVDRIGTLQTSKRFFWMVFFLIVSKD